jgi:hypothetical protein
VCSENHAKNITFEIKTTGEFSYAKNLLSFYENYVENNYLVLRFNKTIDNVFNRLFMIVGKYFLQEGYGKSIHETRSIYKIGHHESFNATKRIQLPFQTGYVSHFRQCLFHNDTSRIFNINQINLDFHFIDCFN